MEKNTNDMKPLNEEALERVSGGVSNADAFYPMVGIGFDPELQVQEENGAAARLAPGRGAAK